MRNRISWLPARVVLPACIAIAVFAVGCSPTTPSPARPTFQGAQQRGADHFRQGDYADAANDWKQAALLAAATPRPADRVDALINLGSAYLMLGQYDLAKASLDDAADLAEQMHDHRRTIEALNALAAACTLKPESGAHDVMPADHVHGGAAGAHRTHHPEELLQTALRLAEHEEQDARMVRLAASIHDNLGNYYADSKQFEKAVVEYRTCVELANKSNDPALAARGLANAGTCGVAAARSFESQAALAETANRKKIRDTAKALRQQAADSRTVAREDNQTAYTKTRELPLSATTALVLNQIGQTDQQLAASTSDPISTGSLAQKGFGEAAIAAQTCGDLLSLSYALGYRGHIEENGDPSTALELTRQAIFAAQKAQSPDSLYRWQWQFGRILAAMGERDRAIESYQQAVETIRAIRNDIAVGNGNQRNHFSFREDVGQLYFELADLLLRKSSATADAAVAEEILINARATLESLKSAELEDYLRDDCVQIYKARNQRGKLEDTKVDGAAVVYIVPLEDRIELLVQVRSHLYARQSPHTRKELDATVTEFRKLLPYVATDEYQASGARLYQWLIEPLEPLLKEKKIDTLVFVPDGLLRTVPMSALYDARTNTHLIEHYAVAVVPGLDMVEASDVSGEHVQTAILVSGLSQERGDFPSLPFVPAELTNVRKNFHADSSDELLNSRFVLENLRSDMRKKHYTVMHIASHGEFGAEASKTFILTFDDKKPITLDELEKLIRPQQYDPNGRPQPLDLLVLSCCQTAAGDDRAALGLAGVAVKSGARSALATLWSVNDQSSTILISEFYRELAGIAGSSAHQQISKARALQQAQKKMLHSDNLDYRHPYVWAPYLIIGNWQ